VIDYITTLNAALETWLNSQKSTITIAGRPLANIFKRITEAGEASKCPYIEYQITQSQSGFLASGSEFWRITIEMFIVVGGQKNNATFTALDTAMLKFQRALTAAGATFGAYGIDCKMIDFDFDREEYFTYSTCSRRCVLSFSGTNNF
jgi:hypothetical protein